MESIANKVHSQRRASILVQRTSQGMGDVPGKCKETMTGFELLERISDFENDDDTGCVFYAVLC